MIVLLFSSQSVFDFVRRGIPAVPCKFAEILTSRSPTYAGPMANHLRVDSLVRWCVAIVFVMEAISVRGTFGGPTHSVRQQTCHVGQNVTLRCHTNLNDDVDWKYKRDQTEPESYVFTNGIVYVTFRPRFTVDRPTEGDYNLVITDVRLSDAGVYVCVEESGFGTKHELELIVNEGDLSELATTAAMTLNPESTKSTTAIIIVVVLAIIVAVVVAIIFVLRLINCMGRPNSQREVTSAKDPETEPLARTSDSSQGHGTVQPEDRSADADESGKNVQQGRGETAIESNVASAGATQTVEAQIKDKPLPAKKPIRKPEIKSAAESETAPLTGKSNISQGHTSVKYEDMGADPDKQSYDVQQENRAMETRRKDKPVPAKKPDIRPGSKSATGVSNRATIDDGPTNEDTYCASDDEKHQNVISADGSQSHPKSHDTSKTAGETRRCATDESEDSPVGKEANSSNSEGENPDFSNLPVEVTGTSQDGACKAHDTAGDNNAKGERKQFQESSHDCPTDEGTHLASKEAEHQNASSADGSLSHPISADVSESHETAEERNDFSTAKEANSFSSEDKKPDGSNLPVEVTGTSRDEARESQGTRDGNTKCERKQFEESPEYRPLLGNEITVELEKGSPEIRGFTVGNNRANVITNVLDSEI